TLLSVRFTLSPVNSAFAILSPGHLYHENPPTPSASSLGWPVMIGSTLGNYKILEKVGEGGQGTVYRAIDSKLGRPVVIKVLPAELTAKEANLKRFEREARLASALEHPNICTIFDLNEINGIHFIAMQYIEGRNVRQLVNGRPLSLESALSIALQTADALAAAH